ncbi:MAG: DmsC/YnfH family molybdoenzyme membrane anchor subunit [Verrucomicrobiota bacterium]|nr:dimethyl sulfoxide reductase anchor subunit [Limisphaera sp.]MDW8382470.1 DmsC/YnfH family molybdoenzyme membrane anchor subunit [Verrucomicrobiota bacterium]
MNAYAFTTALDTRAEPDRVLRALQEQQELPAVERFASWLRHRTTKIPPGSVYRDRLPARPPGPGQQYAFEVDLDRCSACKACVSACHHLNGLDESETWRWTGLLVGESRAQPLQQTVTTACHHCVDPGCLRGCPVLAYEKDPLTGIVRHLDDQCIGCQYCIMQCPYEVPRYSPTRGIVRKCDLCSRRLTRGEAPACVQACPAGAIRITVVHQAWVRERYRGARRSKPGAPNQWLPDAPDPAWTLPTTMYKTARREVNSLRAADRRVLQSQPPHRPLAGMLVLTQASVGLWTMLAVLGPMKAQLGLTVSRLQDSVHTWVAAMTLGLGLAVSILHLGRPTLAWRAFLGLRTSWLSREILAFSLCLLLAGLSLIFQHHQPAWFQTCASATAVTGLVALFCSIMVYADTGREPWRFLYTAPRFFGTSWLLGTAGSNLLLIVGGESPSLMQSLCWLTAAASLFKVAADHRILQHASDGDFSPLHRTALLLTGRWGRWTRLRIGFTILGGLVLPLVSFVLLASHATDGSGSCIKIAFVTSAMLLVCAEWIERELFFRTVQFPRMPGLISSKSVYEDS